MCPGNLPPTSRFPPGYSPSDFRYGRFELCYDAGCDCRSGYASCKLDLDLGTDPSLYDAFADECLRVCSCQDLDERPWIGDKENINPEPVANVDSESADYLPSVGYTKDMICAIGKGEVQFCRQGTDACCKGFDCIGHLQHAAMVLLGLEIIVEIGTCQIAKT